MRPASRGTSSSWRSWLALLALAPGCSDAPPGGAPDALRLDTTRLCAIVPARDAAAGSFPQPPPVKVFGTDLGWTYEAANGRVPILFGDTWQRIDVCPIQTNDDSLGELHLPPSDWPGFTATTSIPDAQCLDVTYEVDEAGTSFAPITLERWDGVAVPLGPLNTPIAGFWDGAAEWAIFLVAGGERCTAAEADAGAACSTELSPQAADLICGRIAGQPLCLDPGSSRGGDSAQAFYLHVAERVGPAAYVSRAMFLTNRYLNLTARVVRTFDERDPSRNDYRIGQGALVLWGRPGFDDLSGDGDLAPYVAWHPLPFERDGGRIVFAPRFLSALGDGGPGGGGVPTYSDRQVEAVPLYAGELEPVNHVSLAWLAPLERWPMVYSGSTTDYADPERRTGRGQPVPGAMYARVARDPWGPWSDPRPILTNEQAAQDLVCGHQAPLGCLAQPDPLIRPQCIEAVDPLAGGNLYGASIVEQMTRAAPGPDGGPAADVFWLYSTWHPYSVVLARTRVAVE